MLPLRDTVRIYSFPIVNTTLIVLTTVVFFFELSLSPSGLYRVIQSYGLVSSRLNFEIGLGTSVTVLSGISLLTHIFLHGGWLHFLSNVWILYIFGDNVEDRMGSVRYLVFYLCAGVFAGLIQVIFTQGSRVPAIGASGAIAGVLGAYFILFPKARVVTLILLLFIPWFVELPALIYLGFWFITQLFSGLASLNLAQGASMGGVAWWAHIGGFLFGMFTYRLFTPAVHPAYYRQFTDNYKPTG
jgi:membrane associated rhomboid family serine protease